MSREPIDETASATARRAVVDGMRGAVIVSCQAAPGSPLSQPSIIAALAQSAATGGAGGFRINGPADVAAVRAVSGLPIVGISKVDHDGFDVRITPTLDDAEQVVRAGASIVALDGTDRPRPGGETLASVIMALHERGIPVLADISTADEARSAVAAGADMVATTLAGYTPETQHLDTSGPALALMRDMRDLPVPVIVEGRIWTPEDVIRSFEAGAYAIVIGSAITAPGAITRRFVEAARGRIDRG